MWKWLSAAAILYGLIAMAFVTSPRSATLTRLMDVMAVNEAWRELAAPVPALHGFDQPMPPPYTHPATPTEQRSLPDGRGVLAWQPDPAAAVNGLALPVRPMGPQDDALHLAVRGTGPNFVILGVREQDGSLYGVVRSVTEEWQFHLVPLEELNPVLRSVDENQRLDHDQIDSVFITVLNGDALREQLAHADRKLRQRVKEFLHNRKQGDKIELEIDDFGLIHREGIPLPPPPGAGRPGMQPPPGGRSEGGPVDAGGQGSSRPGRWRNQDENRQPPPGGRDGQQPPPPHPGENPPPGGHPQSEENPIV